MDTCLLNGETGTFDFDISSRLTIGANVIFVDIKSHSASLKVPVRGVNKVKCFSTPV